MPNDVEFTARLEGATIVWDGPDGNPAKEHKLHVGKGAPPQTIDFKLKDNTGLGLSFDDKDPFHVWENEGCPPPGIGTDQIQVVHSDANKVRVVNANTGPARTLRYQLNVIAKDGTQCSCDPIMQNDGGGPGFV